MKNFRTYDMALRFYKNSQLLRIKNRVLRDQFERATLSIVLNLAEGAGRQKPNDKRRFYQISLGSLRETQCLLEILNQPQLLQQANDLGALLYRLQQNPGGSS